MPDSQNSSTVALFHSSTNRKTLAAENQILNVVCKSWVILSINLLPRICDFFSKNSRMIIVTNIHTIFNPVLICVIIYSLNRFFFHQHQYLQRIIQFSSILIVRETFSLHNKLIGSQKRPMPAF